MLSFFTSATDSVKALFAKKFICMVNGAVVGPATSSDPTLPPSFQETQGVLKTFLDKDGAVLPTILGFSQVMVQESSMRSYIVFYKMTHRGNGQIGYVLDDCYLVQDSTSLSKAAYYADGSFTITLSNRTGSNTVRFYSTPKGIQSTNETPVPVEAPEPPPAPSLSPANPIVASISLNPPVVKSKRVSSDVAISVEKPTVADSVLDSLSALDNISTDKLMAARRKIDLAIGYRRIKAVVVDLRSQGLEKEEITQALSRCLNEL
jgi:hypothetical protein